MQRLRDHTAYADCSLMVPARLPGQAARARRAGANLAPDRAVARRAWEEFLAGQVSPPGGSRPGQS